MKPEVWFMDLNEPAEKMLQKIKNGCLVPKCYTDEQKITQKQKQAEERRQICEHLARNQLKNFASWAINQFIEEEEVLERLGTIDFTDLSNEQVWRQDLLKIRRFVPDVPLISKPTKKPGRRNIFALGTIKYKTLPEWMAILTELRN